MIKSLKKTIWKFLNRLRIGGPIQLLLDSGVLEDGWFKSYYTRQSVDLRGNPIPWCTYSFLKFIEPRLKEHFNIFEYGCGNSTIWYAKKVNSIKSVEHNKNWFELIVSNLPGNAKVVLIELNENGNYAKEVLVENKKYEIIIIDGVERNNSVKFAMTGLTEDGVIIYDNTQLEEYFPSIDMLIDSGFKRIDFIGTLPIVAHNNTTTIFYRDKNCLGI